MKVFRRDRKSSQPALSRNKSPIENPALTPNAASNAPLSPPVAPIASPFPTSSVPHSTTGHEQASSSGLRSLKSQIPVQPPITAIPIQPNVLIESFPTDQTTDPYPSLHVSTPNKPGTLFRLAQLPSTQSASLVTLLPQGPSKLLRAADAARADVVNTLAHLRDRSTLVLVVDAYKPYAIAIARISAALRRQGHVDVVTVPWRSGLIGGDHRRSVFEVSLDAECAFICVLSGITAVREVLETPRQFGMGDEVEVVNQIKSLQKSAGLLRYVEDCIAPIALGQHSGMPPPEVIPVVANMLSTLAIAVAQILHVRRAITSNMSAATVAKLGVAAREHVEQYCEKLEKCRLEQAQLSTDFDQVGTELKYLAYAWMYLYSEVGYETPAPKIAAMEEAMELLKKASRGRIVAQVAKESLETLQSKLDDARNENRLVHRESVPDVRELELPQGRSLVSVTLFHPITVPEDDEAQEP